MPKATITSKGQVTIPASVRRALQVDSGDRIEFVEVSGGRFEVVAATRSIREFEGMFATDRGPVTIEQMNEAIASEAGKSE